MQLHSLRPQTKRRREKRIGRGGKRGTTSGRGTKGQKARAGHKIRPQLRDLIKRFPKLRGYKFHSFQLKPYPVSLTLLEKHFSAGDSVTAEKLAAKGIISRRAGGIPPAKILGGVLSKKLSIIGIPVSKGAKAAIEKAGGSVRLS
ncbi:MAG: 50S ribosomal protein L15 [Candidatus Sungbacteria bacterium]|uniref:Large ribosomal subunit protein uL15 n=1 Tax=Candidatus Sungiibacteriota bacterium TaxID=2750080 RepID=A0A931WPB2_9BACT|nr:50S ribosomal protein L15 [Candidatus Sungbacteria bacterium]